MVCVHVNEIKVKHQSQKNLFIAPSKSIAKHIPIGVHLRKHNKGINYENGISEYLN